MTTHPGPQLEPDRPAPFRWALLPVALALVAAAPTLRGTFLPGDDVQLIRDHVLVNRPSLPHLIELFSVPHRDLYQPVPLATFSAEFWLMRRLGLTPDSGAWLNHLGNALVHAASALLVFVVLRRLASHTMISALGASLFAVHPLNAECVAWLSGRIMMLSCAFTVAAVIAADSLLRRGRGWHIAALTAATLLAMMSKISVALPVLLLLVPWVHRRWPNGRWWIGWGAATVVTAGFVALNVALSRGQLETGQELLQGPRVARVLIALGWYLQHYLVPIGLSAGHPADAVITWSDPRILPALGMVAVLVLAGVLAARHSRQGSAALVWFLAALGPMLPLVPARNILVAERYMYLPGIGLHWLLALGVAALIARAASDRHARFVRGAALAAAGLVAAVLVGLSWYSAGFHRSAIAFTSRMAAFYPHHPGVWNRLAWALYEAGRYDEAIASAENEFQIGSASSRGEAYQVQGMSLLRAGRGDQALAKLQAAVEANPEDRLAHLRLATAQQETGRLEEAAASFGRSAELAPNFHQPFTGQGQVLRKLGRAEEAAEAFRQALANNPYDHIAAIALAELELARGEDRSAAEKLERVLRWMPENAAAHANLGVCYQRLGQWAEAAREFRTALRLDPAAVEPRLNLAGMLAQEDQTEAAAAEFDAAVQQTRYAHLGALTAYSDFLVRQNDLRAAAALWTWAMRSNPGDPVLAAWYAWISALAGQWEIVSQTLGSLGPASRDTVPSILASVLLDVNAGRPEQAASAVSRIIDPDFPHGREARGRLQAGLRGFSSRNPESPWPYYLMLQMLVAEGETDAARVGLAAFEELCPDAAWRSRARALVEQRIDTQPSGGHNAER